MRLAVYSHNYWPEPIGIPFYNTSMCEWFVRKLGWDVTIRTGMPHYPWWKVPADYADKDYRNGGADEVHNGVKIERVRHFVPKPPPSTLGRMRMDVSWLVASAWRSLFTKEKPDAVLLIAPPFLIGLLGMFLRLRWNVPVIYHIQDLQVDAAVELNMMPKFMTKALLMVERMMMNACDLVTTISPGMRQRVLDKKGAPQEVGLFPNWIDDDAIKPWTGANRFRAAWGIPADGIVAMYSGNLGKKQGLEILIQAAAKLPKNVTVVIAGAGGERVELERLAGEIAPGHVRFCDLVDAADLPEFLSAADMHCVVQRSAAAGTVMPSKLLNIMAVARPVVVTAEARTDLANAVESAGAGIVVAPENAEVLAAAITTLAIDGRRRAAAGASARTWIVEQFGIDRVLGHFALRLRLLAGKVRNGFSTTEFASEAVPMPAMVSSPTVAAAEAVLAEEKAAEQEEEKIAEESTQETAAEPAHAQGAPGELSAGDRAGVGMAQVAWAMRLAARTSARPGYRPGQAKPATPATPTRRQTANR